MLKPPFCFEEVLGTARGKNDAIEQTGWDDSVLRAWCEGNWPRIYQYAYKMVGNREEAEDITQETFLRTVRRGFAGPSPPGIGYLFTTALNLVRDLWRRKGLRKTSPFEEALQEAADPSEPDDDGGYVAGLLRRLPSDYKEVLELRIVLGYSRAETAERMGKSEAAVRGLQYRALAAFRTLVSKHPEEV